MAPPGRRGMAATDGAGLARDGGKATFRISPGRRARPVRQQHLSRDHPRAVARQPERACHRRPQQRVAERHQHQLQRLVVDRHTGVVIGCQILDQVVDRAQDRVERIHVAVQDHPAGECARTALLPERVEGEVDHLGRIPDRARA